MVFDPGTVSAETGGSVSNFQMEVPNGDMIAFVANLKRGNTRKKETIVQELRELNTVAYLEEL